MKETLTALWNGNISPWEDRVERRQEVDQLLELLERHHDDLAKALHDAGRESLQKFEDCYDEMLSIEREDAFLKGFTLGAKIFAEALLNP